MWAERVEDDCQKEGLMLSNETGYMELTRGKSTKGLDLTWAYCEKIEAFPLRSGTK